MVAPVAHAIARQAPEILAEIQDQKLVDIVTRSVREAQRPLIRELLAGGRGVPAWLFAAVLLPFLFILGYLFMPHILGPGDDGERLAAVRDDLAAVEARLDAVDDGLGTVLNQGAPLAPDDRKRLYETHDRVMNMWENVWTQVAHNGALGAEVEALKAETARLKQENAAFKELLENKSARVHAYEIQLTRLGIAPENIPNPASPPEARPAGR